MSDWASLPALEDHLWARLDRAVAHSNDPWRFVTLATQGPDGPQARIVGLRGADRGAGSVEVHTDTRTPKVSQLAADPRAQLLLWDPGSQEQLRLSLTIRIEPGDPDRWDRVPDAARGNYGTDPQPGTALPDPEAYARQADRTRFAALVGRVDAMDAVLLASDPHRRAQWRGGVWNWVAP